MSLQFRKTWSHLAKLFLRFSDLKKDRESRRRTPFTASLVTLFTGRRERLDIFAIHGRQNEEIHLDEITSLEFSCSHGRSITIPLSDPLLVGIRDPFSEMLPCESLYRCAMLYSFIPSFEVMIDVLAAA